MRTRAVLVALAVLLGIAALAVYLRVARFDTTLEFSFRDSVSGQWVWDATARLQDRLIFSYFQSDAGPVPLVFSRLRPGSWTLGISAPGYMPASVAVKLRRGANRLSRPIEMVGFEIPNLQRFYVFERLDGGDLVSQLRPAGADGHAVLNHPCLPLWVAARVAVQVRDGTPITEAVEEGSARGAELFSGHVDWKWDPAPETAFRYTIRIHGGRLKPDQSLYRVIDYLIVVPDPRVIDPEELGRLMLRVPQLPDFDAIKAYLDREGKGIRYFFDTSWNVKAREE
jgi:hypothetical protein